MTTTTEELTSDEHSAGTAPLTTTAATPSSAVPADVPDPPPPIPMPGAEIVGYQAHVENVGWQDPVYDDAIAGTVGQSLRMEAIQIAVNQRELPGAHVSYAAHVENIGWQAAVTDDQVAGTVGQSLRMEAINIDLNGAPYWDVRYRAQVENLGWLPEAVNGGTAGTVGASLRLEALDIRIVPKPSQLPGSLAEYRIDWTDFSGPCFTVAPDEELCPQASLQDGDDIFLAVQDATSTGLAAWQLRVVLNTAPAMDWWKEIKAFGPDGAAIEWVDLQDRAHGPVSFVVDARTTAALVFSKAKFLGVHTGMYDLRDLAKMAGKQVTFTWLTD